LLTSLAGALALIVVVVMAVIWWDERPLREAEQLMTAGEHVQALSVVNEFLREHPDHGQAGTTRGRIYVGLGRWSDSVTEFQRHGAVTAQDLHALAVSLLHLEQWSQALPVLEHVVTLNPSDADTLHELAGCQAKLGKFQPALQTATRFAGLDGCEVRGLLLIGTIQREAGNEAKALEAWQRLVDLRPDASNLQISAHEFLREYGSVLLHNGQPESAIDVLRQSLKLNPDSDAETWLGDALLRTGQAEVATQAWQRAVDLHPGNHRPREALARQALQKRDSTQALKWLTPLTGRDHMHASTAYLLHRAASQAGDSVQATEWRQRYNELTAVERRDAAIQHLLIESPESWWAQVIRAWRMADDGNWGEAASLVAPLTREGRQPDPFLQDLVLAIRERGTLPSLDRLPIQQF
jgi:tetratricopeptide (TPR) repeat protein